MKINRRKTLRGKNVIVFVLIYLLNIFIFSLLTKNNEKGKKRQEKVLLWIMYFWLLVRLNIKK